MNSVIRPNIPAPRNDKHFFTKVLTSFLNVNVNYFNFYYQQVNNPVQEKKKHFKVLLKSTKIKTEKLN